MEINQRNVESKEVWNSDNYSGYKYFKDLVQVRMYDKGEIGFTCAHCGNHMEDKYFIVRKRGWDTIFCNEKCAMFQELK